MIKLNKNIKNMLAGLAYQNAGDYLSINEKMQILGRDTANRGMANPSPATSEKGASARRIAFISDGKGHGAPLSYAIDACIRQNAEIDLLMYGPCKSDRYSALEMKISNAGIRYRRVQVDTDTVNTVVDYIIKHPSILYLIASTENEIARELVENVLPGNRRRISIPVVLIEDHNVSRLHSKSAA